MIKGGLSAFKGKKILLLQGPLGPFFRRLMRDLINAGAEVSKINFNGGDWLFSPGGSIAFTGTAKQWPSFFEQVLIEHNIETVLLFGDCRPLHRVASQVANRRGLEVGVFEEGYVRPDYITLERFGVNGHSRMPRDPDFYFDLPQSNIKPTVDVGNTFWHAAGWAILYYLASALLWPVFRHYAHHRPLTIWEGLPWVRGAWRKHLFSRKEKGIQEKLMSTLAGRFFLIPLQVYNDAQILVHSDFDSVSDFITTVMASFARCAPINTHLVIKHHPLDRGYHNYSRLIEQLVQQHGIEERVLYIHDQHLPSLLTHARGVVLINSTVGLSSLHHGTPLMVCGAAIYNIRGLCYQGSLDTFWHQAETYLMDRELFQRFRAYLIEHTQLNGSFYRRLDIIKSYAGLA